MLPVLILLAVIFEVMSGRFMSVNNLSNVMQQASINIVLASGMTFVILTGGIDLSVGSVIAFTSVFVAVMIGQLGVHPLVAFGLVLVIAALFGAWMGMMIHFLRIPPFVATLAGMFLARGAAFLISTQSVPIAHPFLDTLQGLYFRLPGGGRLTFIAMLMLAVFIVGGIIAHRTRFGANIYALGGNQQSAELMGVPIARTTIGIYTMSGILSGLAGIVYTLYTSSGYSLATVGVELDAIASVVIGGTLLTGGAGLVAGTFVGILIQGLIQTYIVFDGTLSSWWTKIAIGILLFLFIALQRGLAWFSDLRRIPKSGNRFSGKMRIETNS